MECKYTQKEVMTNPELSLYFSLYSSITQNSKNSLQLK
jgi:hypothetical protein